MLWPGQKLTQIQLSGLAGRRKRSVGLMLHTLKSADVAIVVARTETQIQLSGLAEDNMASD